MIRTLAAAAAVLALMASTAMAAEHRGGDAALGALSGAVVFGPVGAVAGAVVGYTAGPSIARSWGLHRSRAARQSRKVARDAHAEVPLPTPRAAAVPPAAAQPAPPPSEALVTPPVQTLE
jgi:hypothetical protein